MEIYKDETREILRRFLDGRIRRAECVAALDCALLAAIPELDPADFQAVQAILAENSRRLAEIEGNKQSCFIPSMDRPESVPLSR
jgi:hypothetical protein